MKIVIFGASGTLGSVILQQAIQQGLSVTAFSRNASRLNMHAATNLEMLEGNVLSLPDVERAIKGKDAVICALGDGGKGKIRAAGTATIIQAMKNQGCQRLICQSTLGMGDTWNNLNFFWKRVMFGWFLKKAFEDHRSQEKHVMNSDLNYTIVRPSAFTKGPLTRQYKIDFSSNDRNLQLKISLQDIAHFILEQLHSTVFERKAVSISN